MTPPTEDLLLALLDWVIEEKNRRNAALPLDTPFDQRWAEVGPFQEWIEFWFDLAQSQRLGRPAPKGPPPLPAIPNEGLAVLAVRTFYPTMTKHLPPGGEEKA